MPASGERRELFRGWGPLAAVFGLLAFGLVALMVWSPSGAGGNCESIPLLQFNIAGVTYTARHLDDVVAQADLGDLLETQQGDVPEGLLRCQAVALKNGQGTLGSGGRVYAIHGVDTSTAIATRAGTAYVKLYAP